jgi:hypothetical protein
VQRTIDLCGKAAIAVRDNEPPEEDRCPPRTYKKFKSRRRQRRLGTPRVSDAGLRSWKKTISLRLLAGELAHATDGFRLLPHSSLRGLLVEAPLFHLAKDALALHPLLEDAQRLIHIVVAHENLQRRSDPGSKTS